MILERIQFPWLKIINIQLMYFYNNTDLFFSFSKGRFRFKNWVERKLSYLNVWSIQVIRRVSQPQWWLLPWGPVDFIMDSGLDESCFPKGSGTWVLGSHLVALLWRSGCRTLAGGVTSLEVGFEVTQPPPTSSLLSLLHACNGCEFSAFCPSLSYSSGTLSQDKLFLL